MKILTLISLLIISPFVSRGETVSPELLIVTTQEFLAYADAFAELHRERLSITVSTMVIDKDEEAETVRQKVKEFYEASDGVLKYLIIYGCEWNDVAGDAYFGMVKGYFSPTRVAFTAPDIAVGRIPIASGRHAEEYTAKVVRYLSSNENARHSHEILLAADDGDNLAHQADAEDAVALFADYPGSLIHKIYVSEYGLVNGKAVDARVRLERTLKTGVGLMTYIGHGDETSITGEGLWDSYACASIKNDVLPWGFLSSCRIGKFGGSTMGFSESLLFNGNGGVIGCVTSPQEVYASYNRLILIEFSKLWSARKAGERFGDIWLSAQRKCMLAAASQANKTLGLNTLSFNLLGDPVLPIIIPYQTVECGYIPELGMLAGSIDNCSDGTVVEALVYSSSVTGDGVCHNDMIVGKAVGKIADGAFEIPIKLASDLQSKRLHCDVSAIDGLQNSVHVGYADFEYEHKASAIRHNPVITYCAYEDGYIVADIIADGSGINQNCSAIGGYSACEIDGRVSIPLSVMSSNEDCYRIAAELPLMNRGNHTAKITVIDNDGKMTYRNFVFSVEIVDNLNLTSDNIVRDHAELTWRPVDCQLTLKIADISGDIVDKIDVSGKSSFTWNLKDNCGVRVPVGIYYCYLVSSSAQLFCSDRVRVAVMPE